jgi:tetratricopeptide (TPR) repeat protein
MTKAILFGFLWWLTGSPLLAFLVIIVLIYMLDRRFGGFLPNAFRPYQLNSRLRRAKQELSLSPHHTSLKVEAARILIEKRRFQEALSLLDQAILIIKDSADVWFEIGLCQLKLGDVVEGEKSMLRALDINPRVKYGEPYLRIGEAFAATDEAKSLAYLHRFQDIHSSSCESYYKLGNILERLGRRDGARSAYKEAVAIYRSLPKYKRKSERRWALLSAMKR